MKRRPIGFESLRVAVHAQSGEGVTVRPIYHDGRRLDHARYTFACGREAFLFGPRECPEERTLDTPALLAGWRMFRLPVDDPERPKLRDAVPYGAKKLESLARKFLTLSPEFKPQTVSPCFKDSFPCTCTGAPSPGASMFLSPKWAKHEHWAKVWPTNLKRAA